MTLGRVSGILTHMKDNKAPKPLTAKQKARAERIALMVALVDARRKEAAYRQADANFKKIFA